MFDVHDPPHCVALGRLSLYLFKDSMLVELCAATAMASLAGGIVEVSVYHDVAIWMAMVQISGLDLHSTMLR